MPGYREPRSHEAEAHARADDRSDLLDAERQHGDVALVKAGEPGYRREQQVETILHEPDRQQPAKQPIPEARPKEGAPHERVARTDQLRDFDFLTAILDIEPYGVADDDDDGGAQQQRADQHGAANDIQNFLGYLRKDRAYLLLRSDASDVGP